jgi:hypothetical protein
MLAEAIEGLEGFDEIGEGACGRSGRLSFTWAQLLDLKLVSLLDCVVLAHEKD